MCVCVRYMCVCVCVCVIKIETERRGREEGREISLGRGVKEVKPVQLSEHHMKHCLS